MQTEPHDLIDYNPIAQQATGLTKREYISTQIFAGLMNSKASINIGDEDKFTCALHAVKYADALIRALNKTDI